MTYTTYKYCSDSDFLLIKERLDILKQKIARSYENVLTKYDRVDDSDYLTLNFTINDTLFGGNIHLQFVDKPNSTAFNINVIKTFDDGQYRYFKRKAVYKETELDNIEENYNNLISE